MHKGDHVGISIGSANTDEADLADAYEVILTRNTKHLAFGAGRAPMPRLTPGPPGAADHVAGMAQAHPRLRDRTGDRAQLHVRVASGRYAPAPLVGVTVGGQRSPGLGGASRATADSVGGNAVRTWCGRARPGDEDRSRAVVSEPESRARPEKARGEKGRASGLRADRRPRALQGDDGEVHREHVPTLDGAGVGREGAGGLSGRLVAPGRGAGLDLAAGVRSRTAVAASRVTASSI